MGDTYPEDAESVVLRTGEEGAERKGVVCSRGEGKDAVEEAERVGAGRECERGQRTAKVSGLF